MKKILSILIFSLSVSPVFAATYDIDPVHTYVGFSVKHMVISHVKGNFTDFSGRFDFEPKTIRVKSVRVVIRTKSIDTNHEKRDKDLRSPDFLDVEKYPEMTFILKKSEASGNSLTLTGDLTIRGVTKTVVLKGEYHGSVKDPWGNRRVAFSLGTAIDRFDFGLKWNKLLETGGLVVGRKVKIGLEVEAILRKHPGKKGEAK